jgi:hypothetical protein
MARHDHAGALGELLRSSHRVLPASLSQVGRHDNRIGDAGRPVGAGVAVVLAENRADMTDQPYPVGLAPIRCSSGAWRSRRGLLDGFG